jgi:membrane protein
VVDSKADSNPDSTRAAERERADDVDGAKDTGPNKKPNAFVAAQQKAVAWALRFRVVRAYLLYTEHRGPMLADSITYRALFSVFAAVLLGFSLAAIWLGGNPSAMNALTTALEQVIPGIANVVDVNQIKAPAGFTLVGIVSLIALIGAAIGAITSLRTALRVLADEFTDDSFFLWVILRNVLVGVAFGGLLLVAAAATFLGSAGIEAVLGWFGISARDWPAVVGSRVFGVIIVFVIDGVAIALVFRLLSGMKPRGRNLWVGAATGGFGLTVLQVLSGLFVRGASSNPLLATFASLVALLLWFNLSAQVILIASSYIITATEEEEGRGPHRAATTFGQRRLRRAQYRLKEAQAALDDAQKAELKERNRGVQRT